MDMKLEVIVIPVSDVDRAKRFYESLGFRTDIDVVVGEGFRGVQMTPPGSGCSIIIGKGTSSARPGSISHLVLVVGDVDAARDDLIARGVDVSGVFHYAGGPFNNVVENPRVSGRDPEGRSYFSFASFSDPDGNGWIFQEVTTRLPGRIDPATTAFASANDLASALRRASSAHGEHEARTGQADPNWPDWYAEYMVREQSGEELPQ